MMVKTSHSVSDGMTKRYKEIVGGPRVNEGQCEQSEVDF